MHQKIFVCFKFRWTGINLIRVRTIRKYFLVFTMLEVEPKYIYKRSHGSAEIRSLLTMCQNQELLLSAQRSAFTSDRMVQGMVLLKFCTACQC